MRPLATPSGRALQILQSLDIHLTEYCETRDLAALEIARHNCIDLLTQIDAARESHPKGPSCS